MNIGKTLFAQLMDFLPWSTFTRIVARYGGDERVRTLSCAEHYRAMAFAQLTYRESLRDIEICLSVQASKLYSMGFRDPVRRSTLANANEGRDWRIYAALAERLIAQARKLYLDEDFGLDLANTVYALDSTTIDLCLAVFPWAHFRTTKAAVKMHTLLDLRGKVSETATTIASAVEEQGAATQEIARNVQQAAQGTQEVSANIAGVSQAAQQTGAAATQVLASANELSKNGELLKQQVDDFLREVRAA